MLVRKRIERSEAIDKKLHIPTNESVNAACGLDRYMKIHETNVVVQDVVIGIQKRKTLCD